MDIDFLDDVSQRQIVINRYKKRLKRVKNIFLLYGVVLIVPNIVSVIVKMVLLANGHNDVEIYELLVVLVAVLMGIAIFLDYRVAKYNIQNDRSTTIAKNIVIAASVVAPFGVVINVLRSWDYILRQREYWQFGLTIVAAVCLAHMAIFMISCRRDTKLLERL